MWKQPVARGFLAVAVASGTAASTCLANHLIGGWTGALWLGGSFVAIAIGVMLEISGAADERNAKAAAEFQRRQEESVRREAEEATRKAEAMARQIEKDAEQVRRNVQMEEERARHKAERLERERARQQDREWIAAENDRQRREALEQGDLLRKAKLDEEAEVHRQKRRRAWDKVRGEKMVCSTGTLCTGQLPFPRENAWLLPGVKAWPPAEAICAPCYKAWTIANDGKERYPSADPEARPAFPEHPPDEWEIGETMPAAITTRS